MAHGSVPVYNSTMVNGNDNQFTDKMELVQKLQCGVIVKVSDAEEAKIAEEAGACSIVVHHETPCMPTPDLIKEIKQAVSIPIMARVRGGHFVEAQILEAIDVDYVNESELLGITDDDNYINKHKFSMPFACWCKHLKEALMKVTEGAAIISVMMKIRNLINADEDVVFSSAKNVAVPCDLFAQIKQIGRLPVVLFRFLLMQHS